MSPLIFFALGAGISGTILIMSGFELFFTIKRRKHMQALETQLATLKTGVTEQMNKLTLERDQMAVDQAAAEAEMEKQLKEEKKMLETKFEEKLEKAKAKGGVALAEARKEARELEKHAEDQAEAYLEKRKAEVEEELVDLVVDVSKRVLPKGISYQAQKELVMQALRDLPVNDK